VSCTKTVVLSAAVLLALAAQLAGTRAQTPVTEPAAQEPASKAAKAIKKRAKTVAKGPPPTPAKQLFGAAKTPAQMKAQAIGFYAKGCLAGGAALPIDGPTWQAMRLSRNRNWAHPELISLIQKLSTEAQAHDGWPGLLVGDLSQPRGGPMLTGHASHQVGLDADIWFTPMPDRRLTEKEREDLSATSMLADDRVSVNPAVWSEARYKLLKRAASYAEIQRVMVHPAIKKAVCDAAKDEKNRGWLAKIRPIWGHHYHFHIRMTCPKGSGTCEGQTDPGPDDGCGAELTRWLALVKNPPKPGPPGPEKKPITLAQLPPGCRTVLADGAADAQPAAEKAKPVTQKATVTK
jgi:penicillin-insensitive murein endopeptidase